MNVRLNWLASAALFLAACGSPATATPSTPTHDAATHSAVASAIATSSPASPAVSPAETPSAAPIAAAATTSTPATAAAAPSASASASASATATATAVPAVPTATTAPTATPTPESRTSGTTVTVVLADMTIKLSQASAPAGAVTFSVKNAGSVVHELDVLKTTLAQDKIPNDPARPGYVLEGGIIGQPLVLAPGASGTVTFTLGAGPYVLICDQVAHYLAGMHTAFTVN